MSEIKVNSIKGVGASAAAITVNNTDGTCTANITNNLRNRNLIINGAMQVAQRGTSSTTDGYSTVDRWQGKMGNVSVTPTQSQQSTSTSDTPYQNGFANFFRIALPSAGTANSNGQIEMRHLIESQNILNSGWNYKSSSAFLTLSFWFRCSTNQTFYIYFYNPDSGKVLVLDFTASGNNTWTKITKQLKGDSTLVLNNDNGAGLQVSLFAFHGTAYTNNRSLNTWGGYDGSNFSPDMATTWLTAGASTFDITGVQLEVGSVATDFEHRSFGQELALCQRYYFRLTSNDAGQRYGNGMQVTSSASDIIIYHPVPMRSKPTALETSGTASDYAVARTNTYEVCDAVPVLQVAHTHSTMIRTNQSQASLSTGQSTILRANTTDFVLGFTAEL